MRQKQMLKNGFTLIELLVAMIILAILVSAGVPGMRGMLANNSVRSASDRLANSLAYARGEAVARVVTTGVCSSNNGATCNGSWDDGWLVWADSDGDDAFDAGEVIRVEDNSASETNIANGAAIVFDPVGESANTADVIFTISKTGASTSRQITVSPTGYTLIN